MKNIAKLTSYGVYLDTNDFSLANYPNDNDTHIVGPLADYVYDLERQVEMLTKLKKRVKPEANKKKCEELKDFPKVTWEEFKDGKEICFVAKDGTEVRMFKDLFWGKEILLYIFKDSYGECNSRALTEENFNIEYEACKKIFLGEEV